MGNTYFTADLHLGHEKVAGVRGYKDVAAHDSDIIGTLMYSGLRPRDTLWILGDIMGKGSDRDHALEMLGQVVRETGVTLRLVSGNHDTCVDTSTRAVTKRGLIHIDDLTMDDEILTVDSDMNSIWSRPERIVRYPFDGEAVRIQGGGMDALVTPDHRIVTRSIKNDGQPGPWREALAEDFAPNTKTGVVTSGAGSTLDASVTDEDIRLAAWLYTDSSLKGGRYWEFYQAESKVDKILELLPADQFSRYDRQRNTREVAGRELLAEPQAGCTLHVKAGWFNDHLTTLVSDRDTLSSWLWTLSERQVDVLVSEWEWTDGTIPTSRKAGGVGTSTVLYCSKDGLRSELMALMAANGWRVSETEYRPGQWRINAVKRLLTSQSSLKVTRERYQGDVWCVTMPTGQFFVERGGKVHLTGNCHSMHRRAHREAPKYSPVFDSAQDFARIRYNNSDVLLSHFPYQGSGDRGASERYAQYRLPSMGLPLIHGHTHQDSPTVAHRPNQVCVSWDAWERVASLDEVMKMLNPFGLPMRPTDSTPEAVSEVVKDLRAMTANKVSPLVKPVGRFDPFQKTRWVASYLGAPLRVTKYEAIQDFINWYHAQTKLEA